MLRKEIHIDMSCVRYQKARLALLSGQSRAGVSAQCARGAYPLPMNATAHARTFASAPIPPDNTFAHLLPRIHVAPPKRQNEHARM